MSKHWRPEGKIVRIRPVGDPRRWTRRGSYGAPGDRKPLPLAVPVLLGAVLLGLIAGQMLQWRVAASGGTTDWAAGQPEIIIPEVANDPADAEWERRARSPVMSRPDSPEDTILPGLSRTSGARNDGSGQSIYVIDGDTFVLGRQKIRIANIDTPELHPPRCAEEARLGAAATEKLRALLGSGTVTLSGSGSDHDEHGRLLRNVSVNGQDVGEALIAAGVARGYGSGRRPWC